MQWKFPKFEAKDTGAKMDWFGILLLALTSGMFIYGVTKIKGSNDNSTGILFIVIGAVSMLAYVLICLENERKGLDPAETVLVEKF